MLQGGRPKDGDPPAGTGRSRAQPPPPPPPLAVPSQGPGAPCGAGRQPSTPQQVQRTEPGLSSSHGKFSETHAKGRGSRGGAEGEPGFLPLAELQRPG